MNGELLFIIAFLALIVFLLVVDLGLLSKRNKNSINANEVSPKKALTMSLLVIGIALGFYFFLANYGNYLHNIDSIESLQKTINKHHLSLKVIPGDLEASLKLYNKNIALEYITGYIVEYALSIDNIFVILLIFSSFKVAKTNYHKVLIWGILGAILMRFIFIFVGASLLNRFEWIMYIFGAFLIFTGIRMFFSKEEEQLDTEKHPVVKFAHKYFMVHNRFEGGRFFVVIDGVRKITPLFLVLLIIEFTDLIFAVDSIPAIFSVTKDPYIVFFSNIFAILGLRSMFFLLANIVGKFRYLKTGLAFLLSFIGLKMIFHHFLDAWGFKTVHSLIIILIILGGSIIASLLIPPSNKPIAGEGK
ncbi:TerC/Alx family metal homeostasis membrane protein [Elizabethkingia argentiflava]|uniref:TerC/Alx family metal homeostasis membrane protein n=1 Tax=Elizabethkingia argenteiflava TaxID=2681556 RepID=A0A845PZB1_9FLAO|nr:TerC/Alx family metal homeostasis membrane protein [Elizabethkingia argenteiflava]NAW52146.1 TerC/Alx family metal homeostasis membrane protein [Elizabethkingia argenteiflava]